MKKSKLQNASYRTLLTNFKEWFDILGYSKSAVNNYPQYVLEYLCYLESQDIKRLDIVTPQHIKQYYDQLSERPNKKNIGALSKSSLNQHQQALRKFNTYLKKHNATPQPIYLKSEATHHYDVGKDILTLAEIKQLFDVTAYSNALDRIRYRDKAMLVVL